MTTPEQIAKLHAENERLRDALTSAAKFIGNMTHTKAGQLAFEKANAALAVREVLMKEI